MQSWQMADPVLPLPDSWEEAEVHVVICRRSRSSG